MYQGSGADPRQKKTVSGTDRQEKEDLDPDRNRP